MNLSVLLALGLFPGCQGNHMYYIINLSISPSNLEFEFSLPEAGASSGAGTAAPMTTLSIPEQFSRSEGGLFNSQSTAASELNHLFRDQGFKFKKGTHRLLSRVVATAPNGTTKVFSANIYGDATEDNNELIKWMETQLLPV